MTFERSAAGQANRARFLDVDLVCYVEGNANAQAGDDIAFWSSIFRVVRPDLRVEFIAKGGKPVLEKLATEMIKNSINNIVIAMDADYSRFFSGRIINHNRVIYTHGYSWENDVYGGDHCAECHRHIAKLPNLPRSVVKMYQENWKNIQSQFYWFMQADLIAMCRKTSALPRDSAGRILRKENNGKPKIDYQQCYTLLLEARRKQSIGYRTSTGKPTLVNRDFAGCFVELVARYIANHIAKVAAGARDIGAEHFRQIALIAFEAALASGRKNETLDHHRSQVGAI